MANRVKTTLRTLCGLEAACHYVLFYRRGRSGKAKQLIVSRRGELREFGVDQKGALRPAIKTVGMPPFNSSVGAPFLHFFSGTGLHNCRVQIMAHTAVGPDPVPTVRTESHMPEKMTASNSRPLTDY